MHIGLVGYGVVGRALERFFGRSESTRLSIYDKYVSGYDGLSSMLAVDSADVAFVAVPTPYDPAAQSCDISNVIDVVDKLSVPLCIKSTVPPGTTDALIARTEKSLAFSPEYVGESANHQWPEVDSCGFVIIGGDKNACRLARKAYETVAAPEMRYIETSAAAAELGKYMENTFLASKVAFVNMYYDFATSMGVNYDELREIFLLDARSGESHTKVSPERGFGGKCFPKDMRSIVAWARDRGLDANVLEAVLAYNDAVRTIKK